MIEGNRLEYHGLFAGRTDLRGMEALPPQQQIVEVGVFQTGQRRCVNEHQCAHLEWISR